VLHEKVHNIDSAPFEVALNARSTFVVQNLDACARCQQLLRNNNRAHIEQRRRSAVIAPIAVSSMFQK
jgi:hypothetical protein